jgi:hypothetical protein
MTRTAGVCVALLLACAACGEDAPEDPGAQGSSESGVQPSEGHDASAPGSDAGLTGATAEASASEASTKPDVASDAGAQPAKDAAAKPNLDLHLPTASMQCGGKPCDTAVNVCCESWSKGSGFGTTQSCMTRDDCNKKYSRAGDQNRAIPHECDGKEDCSGGQVCCMYASGMPLCEFADIGDCLNKIIGPGGSGICVDNDLCKLGSTQFVAEGVPLGVLACNDNVDCADRSDTSCQPEESNSLTTGKGVNARANVKVCR